MRYAHRALMIPRVMHRQEQLLRAKSLAKLGLVDYLNPNDLSAETLGQMITECLASPHSALNQARINRTFNFDGAANFAQFCANLLHNCPAPSEVAND